MRERVGDRAADLKAIAKGEGGGEPAPVRQPGDPVDPAQVVAALRELAEECARIRQSDTERLREVQDEVEGALAAGASETAVLAALQAQGLALTPVGFARTLAHLRQERRGQGEGVTTRG